MHGFEVGDKVEVVESGQACNGTVESIQDKLKLVDVRIFEPGHPKHCLVVSFPADQVDLVEEGKKDHETEGEKLSKEDLYRFSDHVDNSFKALNERIAELETTMTSLETRLASVEKKNEDQKVNTPPAESSEQSA